MKQLNIVLDLKRLRLVYPFHFQSEEHATGAGTIKGQGEGDRRRKRVEKAVERREREREREEMREGMRAMGARMEMQEEQIMEIRKQMDMLIGHMIKHY